METQLGHHRNQVARGSIEIFSKPTDGQKNIADIWTTSRRSTSLTPHSGIRGTGTRAPSRWGATMRIVKLDQRKQEKDFNTTTKFLASLRQDQGRQNSFIPKNERMRQRPFDEALRPELKLDESNLENLLLATFFLFIISTKLVAARTSKRSMARSPMARSQVVKRVKATDSLHGLCGSHFARFLRIRRYVQGPSLTGNSDSLVIDGG